MAGYNVHSIALQVPKAELRRRRETVGVWATTTAGRSGSSRQQARRLNHRGRWVQVSRLGMPLVNEVVIPVGQKDKFNGSQPRDDGQFAAACSTPSWPT